jgi:hypothetical protein
MPAFTSGSGDNGMKHAMVSLSGTTLSVHTELTPTVPLTLLSGHGIDYTPAKFDVLENTFFNAQYGWIPAGFISLPANRTLWIERTGATQPAGSSFATYEGGNLAEGMAAWNMQAIHAVDGDLWQWDGMMQHDYYTADLAGAYAMHFNVYVGDLAGQPDPTYTPASTHFAFTVVPEPASGVLASLAMLGFATRKR